MNQKETPTLTWDDRVALDPIYWIAAEVFTEDELIASGERDFLELFPEQPESTGTALEIGCGVGRLLLPASRVFAQLYGVDVSPQALANAERLLQGRERVTLSVASSGAELPDITVDIVYSFATLPHLTPRVFLDYLDAMFARLQVGGVATVQIYTGNEVLFHETDTYSIRSYDASRLRATLELIGFSDITIRPLKLPYDGIDHERGREPVVVEMHKSVTRDPSDILSLYEVLCSRREEATGVPSEDEYRVCMTRANMLLREKRLSEAEKFLSRAVLLKNNDADVAALTLVRASLGLERA